MCDKSCNVTSYSGKNLQMKKVKLPQSEPCESEKRIAQSFMLDYPSSFNIRMIVSLCEGILQTVIPTR